MVIAKPDSPADICAALRAAIEASLPGAEVEVTANSPGHFELRVVSAAFADKPTVRQQQLVYGAIAPLMSGDSAPVHAIDRLRTVVP